MAAASIPQMLEALELLVDALQDEASRINRERLALLAGTFSGLGFLGFGDLQTRADSMLALLEAIDHHVGEVLPRMIEKAVAGDAAAAAQAVVATKRILTAVTGVSPTDDLIDDVVATVKDAADDTMSMTTIALLVLAAAFIVRLVLR